MQHPFPYLVRTAERYGVDELQVTDPLRRKRDSTSVIEELTAADLTELARAYREILRRDDAALISKWLREDSSRESRRLSMLLLLFKRLGRMGVPPFDDARGWLQQEPRPPFDWTKVPHSLRCLAPAAEEYGDVVVYGDIDEFLRHLDRKETDALVAAREFCDKHAKEIHNYIDDHPIDRFRESAQLEELMSFMDDNRVRRFGRARDD